MVVILVSIASLVLAPDLPHILSAPPVTAPKPSDLLSWNNTATIIETPDISIKAEKKMFPPPTTVLYIISSYKQYYFSIRKI